MMTSFFSKIIDFFFPPHEVAYRASQVNEEEILSELNIRYHRRLNTYTALPYRKEEVRHVIKANKFYASSHAARLLSSALVELLSCVLEENALSQGGKLLLIPIPSSKKRKQRRGKNQVERIIESLPKETLECFIYETQLLKRKDRPSQARVPKYMRGENIKGAFYVSKPTMINHSGFVILVDDVIESGSTMKDAMRALKQAGIRNIIGVALAK